MYKIKPTQLLATSLVLLFATTTNSQAQTPQEQLGDFLYNDLQLSEPAGQGCVTCHDPGFGFVDPVNVETGTPVSQGVDPVEPRFGKRNSPSAGYASLTPVFTLKGGIQGGQFWDGRARDLAAQARGPFLNPDEMANTSRAQVIGKIQTSTFKGGYAALFEQVCGPDAFAPANVDASYICMSEAIAAFEGTEIFSPFTSKFDAVQAGLKSFTPEEEEGRALFSGNAKCGHCHTAKVGGGRPVLFTDFKYHNIGLPANPEIFALRNEIFTDLGLGGPDALADPKQFGKFKNPHLRNIELTPPYMHNGVLTTLKQVVHFYNTRDVLAVCEEGNPDLVFGETCWPAPEVPDTMDSSFLGNLNLTDAEEDAIVAFMRTFTDDHMTLP